MYVWKAPESHNPGYVKLSACHGIAEKNLSPMELSNVGGYPSETHLKTQKIKTRKISLVHSIPFSLHMFLIFCTDHVSITAVQCTTIESMWNKLWANGTSLGLSLRYVSDRYPVLHKAPDCDPEPKKKKKYQPLPVASTSYHDFTKIRYPIILLKDERKQHIKNPMIILNSRE